ncbi:MAG: toxin-antitoxin system YwqK family antitoxin [Helicobacteraceae bacterium]|jgi:antitoxin component YwqK of YwqJK toxin-antitoxin module|nr:toxin-antitoxin system YwqK family antitoxin [Helicobacteraceae bacterium]
MKRVLIAILLAMTCQIINASQSADSDYKIYVVNKTARVDKENGKCMDMDGNLLPGKAEVRKPLRDGGIFGTLCIDGEATGERNYSEEGVLYKAIEPKDANATEARGYYYNGELKYITPYKNGKLEGVAKYFFQSGEVEYETPYKNGKREGVAKHFYGKDTLLSETPYENDRENGISKSYYRSGKLLSEQTYKNGFKDGNKKFYYESGELEYEVPENYGMNGDEVIVKYFYKNGKLKEEIPYKGIVIPYRDIVVEGIGKTYYESGELQSEIPYKIYSAEGIGKIYYENGKLKQESTYKNDRIEGEMKTFRRNGKIWGVFTYKKNKAIDGVCHKTNGKKTSFTKAELENLNNKPYSSESKSWSESWYNELSVICK